tara:strand:- start:64100 stop:64723 length:624 start_codon:yes stop_codon:yes gene_type:complete
MTGLTVSALWMELKSARTALSMFNMMDAEHKAYDLSRIDILIVEDNKHMQALVRDMMRALGVNSVRTADDGASALKVLIDFEPDIIVTDWKMHPLNGVELVQMIRTGSDSKNPYVPVIMLSAYTEYKRVKEAVDAGVNEFLAKPVSVTGLYNRIVSIIDRPRPFIRNKSYTGPDRRRHDTNSSNYEGKLRRETDGDVPSEQMMAAAD